MRMIDRYGIGVLLLTLCMSFSGCFGKGDSKNAEEKTAGKPPVAVEVTKISTTDLTEGIEVVGSLSPKFSADVKSEYAGIVTDVYVTEWVTSEERKPVGENRCTGDGDYSAEG